MTKTADGTFDGEIIFYYYADVQVVDTNGNPVNGANVSFVCSDPAIKAKNVNYTYEPFPGTTQDIEQTYTRSNGHTPLPSNIDLTVAIVDFKKDITNTYDFDWTISASKDGYSNSTTVNLDSSWYRSDPDTYQNTITIVLDMGGPDTTPPTRSNGQPTGTFSSGTTQTNISLTTNENSTCKYSTVSGVSYASMPNTFSTTGNTSHSKTITNLTDGQSYTYFVRCIDSSSNSNIDDYTISFSIAEPASNDLIAHWNFNETSGITASDSSGNNNNGTLINMDPATDWVNGKIGGALDFDGEDDYVRLPTNILRAINKATISAWFRTTDTAGAINTEYGNSTHYVHVLNINDSKVKASFGTSGLGIGLGVFDVSYSTNINDGNWHHAAAVYNGSQVLLYVDGFQRDSADKTGNIVSSYFPEHAFGAQGYYTDSFHSQGDGFFNGAIDNLRIYSRALTPSEILAHYNEGNAQQDQTPPTGSILINSGDEKTNSQTANLTISATDDSGLSEMKISETNNIDLAIAEPYSTIKSFVLSIGDGIKTIYIWFKDTIGNWNTELYSDSITLDSTGPIISNIQSSVTINSSTITFQTNENSTSQIEYDGSNPFSGSYNLQTTKDSNLKTSHSVNLTDLSSNTTYHYRIVSEDNLTNSSNSIDKTFKTNQSSVPDSTSPAAITDLESDNITQTSADLKWTSPGDDGNIGTASSYDIRYSTSNITESNWNSATQITGEPIPQSAGTEQSIYIAVGLSPNTKYYFAIKTSDEVPNVSDISNIVSFTTLSSGGGSPGGGGTISDTTPPSKPSNFKATGADKQIILKWNNPTDSDFVRVLLIKKENSFPLSKDDGTVIYEGTNQEYTDIELDNSKTYYYAIFAYDKKPNYSEILTISAKPIEGKETIPIPNPNQTYPEGTLLKIPESFKIYVIINQKKKWIPTPEVFETLGYQWTNITEINKTELNNIQNYEDNLIRAIQDYKVYLVVNGIKRHIPNPEIFLNYGFEWDDVKDVNQETINQYSQNLLIKESKQQKVYYLCPERKIRRWLRSPEIFNSYNNKWEDIQVISKYEMEYYRESNLIRQYNSNDVYLIEGNNKRLIQSAEEFERLGLDWGMVMGVGEVEMGWFGN